MFLTGGNGTAKLWNLNGKCLITIDGHTSSTVPPIFNSPGTMILTVGDSVAKLWDLKRNCRAELRGHTDFITVAAFSPDQSKIVTGSSDGTVKLWNVQGACLATLNGYSGPIKIVRFNPDGTNILVIATASKTPLLWDGKRNWSSAFADHDDEVCAGAFSPDGSLILTASKDGKVCLSNRDGVCLEMISMSGQSSTASVAFNGDGAKCITAFGNTIKLWEIVTSFSELKHWLSSNVLDADAIQFDSVALQKKIDIGLGGDELGRKRWLAVAELLQRHRTDKTAVLKRLYELWVQDKVAFSDLEVWFKKNFFDVDTVCDAYFALAIEKLLAHDIQKGLRIAHLVQEFRTEKAAVCITLFQLYTKNGSGSVLDYIEDWYEVHPIHVDEVFCDGQTFGNVIDQQHDKRLLQIFKRMPHVNSSRSISSAKSRFGMLGARPLPHMTELLHEIELTTKDVTLLTDQVVLFNKHAHWLDIPYEQQVIINGQIITMGEWFDQLDGKDIQQRELKSRYYNQGGKS